MVEHGADINIKDNEDHSLSYYAYFTGNKSIRFWDELQSIQFVFFFCLDNKEILDYMIGLGATIETTPAPEELSTPSDPRECQFNWCQG